MAGRRQEAPPVAWQAALSFARKQGAFARAFEGLGRPFSPASLSVRAESGAPALRLGVRGVPPALVLLGQLRGRTLSVAALKFVDQLSRELNARFETGERPAVLDA